MSHLLPCPSCARHIWTTEANCPFCATPVSEAFSNSAPGPLPTGRVGRAALLLFSTSVAGGAVSCGDGGEVDNSMQPAGTAGTTNGMNTGGGSSGASNSMSMGGDGMGGESAMAGSAGIPGPGQIQPVYGAPAPIAQGGMPGDTTPGTGGAPMAQGGVPQVVALYGVAPVDPIDPPQGVGGDGAGGSGVGGAGMVGPGPGQPVPLYGVAPALPEE